MGEEKKELYSTRWSQPYTEWMKVQEQIDEALLELSECKDARKELARIMKL
jgi:hypothetical protein